LESEIFTAENKQSGRLPQTWLMFSKSGCDTNNFGSDDDLQKVTKDV